MAFPSAIESGAGETLANPALLLAARIFFLLLAAVGVWLGYIGWVRQRADAPVDNVSATTR